MIDSYRVQSVNVRYPVVFTGIRGVMCRRGSDLSKLIGNQGDSQGV